ncbi:MAG: tRNA lysidine(34) synthetase TilS [Clostridia bacterium]|nr:tRNA lysidine(34) synthetase TilS [Clostridia bacterium]
MLKINVDALFSSDVGKGILADTRRAMTDYSMWDKVRGGVLVGLSGGADSVMLAALLSRLRDEGLCGKILAVHVNHKIRGEEAERDAEFSREISESLGIEFILAERDIPTIAKETSIGLEEAARNARYSIFEDILQSRSDISCIATAHNSTDNLETVIINMFRGAGTRGLSGISPVRDSVIRPLIYSKKENIVSALNLAAVPFVYDSTNSDTAYTRNYVRQRILPLLSHLSPDPELMVTRSSKNLREDADYLDAVAKDFLCRRGEMIPSSELSALDFALFSRVVALMAKRGGSTGVESVHIEKIRELVSGGDFSVSLPGGVSFISSSGEVRVGKKEAAEPVQYEYKLDFGVNFIAETGFGIILSDTPIEDSSLNVYKKSIKTAVDSDIIVGGITVREKRDGDKYVFGGKTRKLKKLFNDVGLSELERAKLPIISDSLGILWVPGFRVRDGGKKNAQKKVFIAVVE